MVHAKSVISDGRWK